MSNPRASASASRSSRSAYSWAGSRTPSESTQSNNPNVTAGPPPLSMLPAYHGLLPRHGPSRYFGSTPGIVDGEVSVASSYRTVGSGAHHVIALHGWFGSAQGWGAMPDYVDGARFTYVFPDLRGYGGRRDEAGEFTMAEA